MPTHDPIEPQKPEVDSPGYEVTDVNVNGIVVFLASLGAAAVPMNIDPTESCFAIAEPLL